MRTKFCRFILVLCLCAGAINEARSQDSRRVLFNSGWRFFKGDVSNAQRISFDDKQWRQVDLPHDWSIEGPFSKQWASGTGYLPAGIGWYRKQFVLPDGMKNKNIYLYFDGVYKNSEVWINGMFLGRRPNGYASFYYDISPHLKRSGQNVVAVRVDHTDFADSRWYTGSGINRNVYLIPVEGIHIDVWGVQFVTPIVTEHEAEVVAGIRIRNVLQRSLKVKVKSELLNEDGSVMASAERDVESDASENVSLNFSLASPQLWSPDRPVLYTLRTRIITDGKISDEVSEQVGFRYMKFDADSGFSLNGVNLKLKGVCFHDDAGALGSAVPEDVWERRLRILKNMGCNSIRMSHNPHQDYIYAMCDRLGFLVQDEAFDEWEVGKNKWIEGWNVGTPGKDGYHKDFQEWAERDLQDMVLRNRNRVSIIMWSIGNEIDYPNDPYTHEILSSGRNPQIYGKGHQPGNPPAKRLGEISKRLVSVVKRVDTTRFVTAALAGVVMSNTTEYPGSLDIVGYNYQEYRYQEDHAAYPARVIYGSENGKSAEAWQAVTDNPFISAQYLWTGFDFIGEARSWPSRSSGAGLIDMAGFPKPQYFQRKAMWSSEPVVYLSATSQTRGEARRDGASMKSHWNWNAGDSMRVFCYSNVEEAELILNGRSLGRKHLRGSKDYLTAWDLAYVPGRLEVIGRNEGKEVSHHSLVTSGDPEMLSAIVDRERISSGGVAHIEIHVTDKNGHVVPEAENEISVLVEGPGKLICLKSGSLISHEDYKASRRKAVGGKLLAFVKATGSGIIKVKINSSKLKSYEIQVDAE